MLDFPDSVVELFRRVSWQALSRISRGIQKVILKGKKPLEVRPGELLEQVDFEELKEEL